MELKLWVDFWPGQVLIVGKGGEEVEETEEQVIEQLGSTNLKPPSTCDLLFPSVLST